MVYPIVIVSAEREGIHAKPAAGAERKPRWNGWEGLNSIRNALDGDKNHSFHPFCGCGRCAGPWRAGMNIAGAALALLGSPGCSAVTELSPGHPRQPPGARACRGSLLLVQPCSPGGHLLLPGAAEPLILREGVTHPALLAALPGLSPENRTSLLPRWVLGPSFHTFTGFGPFPY